MKNLLVILILIMSVAAYCQTSNLIVEKNIVYGKVGDRELTLNMATLNDNKKDKPVVILIHGGGWSEGNKDDMLPFADWFANKGYVAFCVGYRLSGEAKFPAQIEDCKTAVRFVRANYKKYNINPNKVVSFGCSAGGHLASLLGVMPKGLYEGDGNLKFSSKVQAVINYVGPVDLSYYPNNDENNWVNGILKLFLGDDPKMLAVASPITYVSKSSAPHLMFFGSEDKIVPYKQSDKFVDKMKKSGVYCDVYVHPGGGHGYDFGVIIPKIDDFLEKFIINK